MTKITWHELQDDDVIEPGDFKSKYDPNDWLNQNAGLEAVSLTEIGTTIEYQYGEADKIAEKVRRNWEQEQSILYRNRHGRNRANVPIPTWTRPVYARYWRAVGLYVDSQDVSVKGDRKIDLQL